MKDIEDIWPGKMIGLSPRIPGGTDEAILNEAFRRGAVTEEDGGTYIPPKDWENMVSLASDDDYYQTSSDASALLNALMIK